MSVFAGTTLVPAVSLYTKKLLIEWRQLRQATRSVSWLSPIWWGLEARAEPHVLQETDDGEDSTDETLGMLEFEDWVILDAMYRSRTLELPDESEVMIPGIDFVNHRNPANAIFRYQEESNDGTLLPLSALSSEDEIFISYGDLKSPLEFLFSYGFIPDHATKAKTLRLSLRFRDDDPLAPVKVRIAAMSGVAPGIEFSQSDDGTVSWESTITWLVAVNEEDGLGFRLIYGDDGDRDIAMTFKDETISLSDLKSKLEQEPLWDLFSLRAAMTVLSRVQEQLQQLESSEPEGMEAPDKLLLAHKLRSMEGELLRRANSDLEAEVSLRRPSPDLINY